MTELRTGELRKVRMDIVREKLHAPDSVGTWKNYATDDESRYVERFWAWTHTKRRTGDFVEIVSRRCMFCYSEDRLYHCPDCNAAFVCASCYFRSGGDAFSRHEMGECGTLSRQIAQGYLLHKDEEQLASFCIAVKDQAFGEGAERIVRKGEQ